MKLVLSILSCFKIWKFEFVLVNVVCLTMITTFQCTDPEYQRQVEAYIERIQTAEGPKLQCRACQKITHAKSKATMVNHVEATHIQATVACNYCNKTFKARSYLKNHLKKCGPAN